MHAHRPSIVSVRSLTKRYGATIAVDGASLDFHPGRITCLLGPSGCGKSTLLRVIAGLEQADEGEIEAGGRSLLGPGTNVPPEQRRIGFVFQDFALFPHLTALDNVLFGLRGEPAAEARARAAELLDRFHLSARAAAWPHSLSGGEQQRVAIARALAPRPTALLLDEPFSGLDGDLRSRVRDSVLAGLRDTEAAVLVVTHDPEEAMLLGDELLLMSEGRIVQSGTPEECYFRPNSVAAARLLGRVNVLPATVAAGRAQCAFGALAAEGRSDGPAMVLLRPEALRLAPDGVAAEVLEVRFGGPWYEVRLRADGEEAVMRVSDDPPDPGQVLTVALVPRHAVLL